VTHYFGSSVIVFQVPETKDGIPTASTFKQQHFFIWKPKSKELCQRNYRTYTNGILPTNSATVSNLVVVGRKFLRWHATLLFAVDTCFVVQICGLGLGVGAGVGADMARTNARSHQTRTTCPVMRNSTTTQRSVSSFISSCRFVCGIIFTVFGDTGDSVGKVDENRQA
jgi:hypothetical protein